MKKDFSGPRYHKGLETQLYMMSDAVKHYTTLPRICTINPLNAELNPICHLLALLGGATIVVVSRLRVKNLSVSNTVLVFAAGYTHTYF